MTQLLARVWVPVLLYVLSLGVGLLADAVLRADLPPALIPPTGMALAMVLVTPGYKLGLAAPLAIVLMVVAALVGLVVARRRLVERAWAPTALLAGLGVYVLYMAPVVLSGHATWAGYNFVNDTSSLFNFTTLLEHHGATAPTDITGTANNAAYLVNSGYPLGTFSLLATLRPLSGVALEAMWQPVIAMFAVFAGMSLTELARRCGLRPWAAVVAAVLALGGVLTYRYSLHGAVKEIALVALTATAAGLGALAVERRLAVRIVALAVVVCLAMVLAFSAAAGAFALALALAVLVAALASPNRPSVRHVARLAGVVVVVGVVVLLPVLGSTLDFANTIHNVFKASGGASTGMFGQLLRPLPLTEAAGVWVSEDYRLPAISPLHSNPWLVGIAVAVAIVGIVWCVARRRVPAVLLLVTVLVPLAVLAPVSSPYIDGKLLMVATPALVFAGLAMALGGRPGRRRELRIAGLVAAGLVALGVLASDFYGYREVQLGPSGRVAAMKDAAAHVPGRGLWEFNEWEEYGRYFMRAARVNPASEAESKYPVKLRRDRPIFGHFFDLDRQQLSYVERFAGVITRRSPVASRPPANFRPVYANAYYELWKREATPRVIEHLSLQGQEDRSAVPRCRAVRALVRRARPGDLLVGARAGLVPRLSPFRATRPSSWRGSPDTHDAVVPHGPGVMAGVLSASGRRRVWLRMSGGRKVTVAIDGHVVGRIGQVNTPDQWLQAGQVTLSPGQHRIEVRRAGASWRPGDTVEGIIGAVALEPVAPDSLVSVPPARAAARLCGRPWDWIELVRGKA
jgi:hypothetical protein